MAKLHNRPGRQSPPPRRWYYFANYTKIKCSEKNKIRAWQHEILQQSVHGCCVQTEWTAPAANSCTDNAQWSVNQGSSDVIYSLFKPHVSLKTSWYHWPDLAWLTTSHRCLAMGLLHNYLDDPGSRPAQSMHALYMIQLAVHPVVYIHTHTRLTALCPGLPGWASTRKVEPIWILLKREAVASAGPYASLHLVPDR